MRAITFSALMVMILSLTFGPDTVESCSRIQYKYLDICQFIFSPKAVKDYVLPNGRFKCDNFKADDTKLHTSEPDTSAPLDNSNRICNRLQYYLNTDLDLMLKKVSANPKDYPGAHIYRIHSRFMCYTHLLRWQPEEIFPGRSGPSKAAFATCLTQFPIHLPALTDSAKTEYTRKVNNQVAVGSGYKPACLYLHGSGEQQTSYYNNVPQTGKPEFDDSFWLSSFHNYWDRVPKTLFQDNVCEPVYFRSDTLSRGWSDHDLQVHFCSAITHTRPITVFTHSMGNLIIAAGVARNIPGCHLIKKKSNTYKAGDTLWYGIQGPLKGTSAVQRIAQECAYHRTRDMMTHMALSAVNYCANVPDHNVALHTAGNWGLVPPYASMHPRYWNPSASYTQYQARLVSHDIYTVTPELHCDHSKNIIPVFKAILFTTGAGGRNIKMSVAAWYLRVMEDRVRSNRKFRIKAEYGPAIDLFNRKDEFSRTEETGYAQQTLPLYQTYVQPWDRLRNPESINQIDIENVHTQFAGVSMDRLDRGIAIRIQGCDIDGSLSGTEICGPWTDYIITKKTNDYERVEERYPTCVRLIDVASQYMDGSLCSTSERMMFSSMQYFFGFFSIIGSETWAVSYFSRKFNQEAYWTGRKRTAHIWSIDRDGRLFTQDDYKLHDGMVPFESCAIGPRDTSDLPTLFAGSMTTRSKRHGAPTDLYYRALVNHVDGECIRADDSDHQGKQPCAWQKNRVLGAFNACFGATDPRCLTRVDNTMPGYVETASDISSLLQITDGSSNQIVRKNLRHIQHHRQHHEHEHQHRHEQQQHHRHEQHQHHEQQQHHRHQQQQHHRHQQHQHHEQHHQLQHQQHHQHQHSQVPVLAWDATALATIRKNLYRQDALDYLYGLRMISILRYLLSTPTYSTFMRKLIAANDAEISGTVSTLATVFRGTDLSPLPAVDFTRPEVFVPEVDAVFTDIISNAEQIKAAFNTDWTRFISGSSDDAVSSAITILRPLGLLTTMPAEFLVALNEEKDSFKRRTDRQLELLTCEPDAATSSCVILS